MNASLLDLLTRQLDTAWALTTFHLKDLDTEECLWRPAPVGPHVHRAQGGRWVADWPEHEGYGLGPASIAWVTWHITFWWSMVLDHSFASGEMTRQSIDWPGDAPRARRAIGELHDRWRREVAKLTDIELAATTRTKWPMRDRPFADVVAWVNIELTKNAAELGYARFLYGARQEGRDAGAALDPRRAARPDDST